MAEDAASSVVSERQQRAAVWFAVLRDRICAAFEAIEDEFAGADAAALKTKVDAIAPLETGARRGRGFGPGAGGGVSRQTLASVSEAAMAAAMAMQGADIAPTAGQVAAAAKARADVKAMMDQWSALKASSPVK